jgi:hypothetical protein
MQLQDVGDVIASRLLEIREPSGSIKEVTVSIGRPRAFPDPPHDYFVPYHIVGIGPEKVHYAAGVDAVQALQLVMQVIGDHLAALNGDSGGAMSWDAGQAEGDFGFPVYKADPEAG